MTSRNTWISPSTDYSTNLIQIPLTLTTMEDSPIAPLMHRPSNELFVNNNKVVADSLDATDKSIHLNTMDRPDDVIRVISMESDSASYNSPPLSPTFENGNFISTVNSRYTKYQLIYSRTSLIRTPGDHQNVYSFSEIIINRCHLY